MKYGKQYTFRYSRSVKNAIICSYLLALGIGTSCGYVIATMSSTEATTTAVEPVLNNSYMELPKDIFLPTEDNVEAPITYYDCPLSTDIQDYIIQMCSEKNIPIPLVLAVIETESSFKSDAISPDGKDYGLMQINKINHNYFSDKHNISDFLDPFQNIFCGVTMLSDLYSRYKSVDKTLMAYNMGATGAKKLWDKGIYSTRYTEKVKGKMTKYENI